MKGVTNIPYGFINTVLVDHFMRSAGRDYLFLIALENCWLL